MIGAAIIEGARAEAARLGLHGDDGPLVVLAQLVATLGKGVSVGFLRLGSPTPGADTRPLRAEQTQPLDAALPTKVASDFPLVGP